MANQMWVGITQRDLRLRPVVAGRPVDVRTHIGFRLAVCPLSGVVEAMLAIASVYYIRQKFENCPVITPVFFRLRNFPVY
jgi:hypothetical protein